jgi:hypothetical protein
MQIHVSFNDWLIKCFCCHRHPTPTSRTVTTSGGVSTTDKTQSSLTTGAVPCVPSAHSLPCSTATATELRPKAAPFNSPRGSSTSLHRFTPLRVSGTMSQGKTSPRKISISSSDDSLVLSSSEDEDSSDGSEDDLNTFSSLSRRKKLLLNRYMKYHADSLLYQRKSRNCCMDAAIQATQQLSQPRSTDTPRVTCVTCLGHVHKIPTEDLLLEPWSTYLVKGHLYVV